MELTYYKTLKSNPHFSLKDLSPLIKRGVTEQKAYIASGLPLGGLSYSFAFDPSTMELTIEWTDEDEETYKRKIQIVAERSNLPSLNGSVVYYFVCPRTGHKSRILYKVGSYFWSRRAFKAVYPQQMESRHSRAISYREEPYRKHGKEYYRGKLTPYGKRCIRYEVREQSIFGELEKFLERSNKRLQNLNKENAKRNAPPSRTRSKPQRSKGSTRRKSGGSLLPYG